MTRGAVLGSECNGIHQSTAQSDSGEEPQKQQLRQRGCEPARQCADTEDHGGREDDRTATETVGERRDENGSAHQSQQTGTEGHPQRALRQAPVTADVRREIADDLHIQPIREDDQAAKHCDPDAQRAQTIMK